MTHLYCRLVGCGVIREAQLGRHEVLVWSLFLEEGKVQSRLRLVKLFVLAITTSMVGSGVGSHHSVLVRVVGGVDFQNFTLDLN